MVTSNSARPGKRPGILELSFSLWRLIAAFGWIAAVVTVLGFFGSLWRIFDLFSHFRLQLLAGLVLVSALLLVRRAQVVHRPGDFRGREPQHDRSALRGAGADRGCRFVFTSGTAGQRKYQKRQAGVAGPGHSAVQTGYYPLIINFADVARNLWGWNRQTF